MTGSAVVGTLLMLIYALLPFLILIELMAIRRNTQRAHDELKSIHDRLAMFEDGAYKLRDELKRGR